MKKKSVFIDGSSGTTGLQVVSRLSQRADISLISLPDKEKKLKEKRLQSMQEADLTILCLPDLAAIEAVELVKEQVYRRLNGEIPYVLRINPVSCKFLRDGSLRIEQDLLVNHIKKKKIVVGKRGQAIGQIGCRARAQLERQLEMKVHLILNVKVKKQE